MKSIIVSIMVLLALISCSSINKSVKQKPGIKSVKRATVQEFFPGIEKGYITYKFVFELDLGKDVQIDSLTFNGKTTALQAINKENTFTGKVGFTAKEINAFTDIKFTKTRATIVYSTSGVEGIKEVIQNIKVLESTYMP